MYGIAMPTKALKGRKISRDRTSSRSGGALGNVDVQYVVGSCTATRIDLAARKSWCESNDPELHCLYVAPPAKVLWVD